MDYKCALPFCGLHLNFVQCFHCCVYISWLEVFNWLIFSHYCLFLRSYPRSLWLCQCPSAFPKVCSSNLMVLNHSFAPDPFSVALGLHCKVGVLLCASSCADPIVSAPLEETLLSLRSDFSLSNISCLWMCKLISEVSVLIRWCAHLFLCQKNINVL